MTSYRPDRDAQPGMWVVNHEGNGPLPGYRTVPFISHRNSPMDSFQQGPVVADSGYASPMTESAVKGPYGTYYATPGDMKYSSSSGTYPGARSTITVTKMPVDNQIYNNYTRSQEYEDTMPSKRVGDNSGSVYFSQTLPAQRSPSSYRSIVVTQVEPRSPQTSVSNYAPHFPEMNRPIERHIDVHVQQRSTLPQGATSRLVYSSQPAPQGVVYSKPFNPTLPPHPLDDDLSNSSQSWQPATRAIPEGLNDPRPYQLKPTMDPVSNAVSFPRPMISNFDSGKEAEVDALTDLLMQNMQVAGDPDFFGMCARCGRSIMGENSGCSALDQLFHIECFRCISCHMGLRGHAFYAMEGKPYCESCYMETLEKCSVCSKPITDRMLRATGKPFHPACFNCVVCGQNLDGVAFTVDASGLIHCIDDFHRKFAPRCCVCSQPIMPRPGKEETIRIVALDCSFHVECYRCEDCGMLLSSECEGRGCYPLDDHILCKSCNAKRIQLLTRKMTTEL